MKFETAQKKLKKIANGLGKNYYSVTYCLTISELSNTITPKCSLYIDGLDKIFSGVTWKEAFSQLDEHLNPKEIKVDPIEAPSSDDEAVC